MHEESGGVFHLAGDLLRQSSCGVHLVQHFLELQETGTRQKESAKEKGIIIISSWLNQTLILNPNKLGFVFKGRMMLAM